jgi:hypothetical protein
LGLHHIWQTVQDLRLAAQQTRETIDVSFGWSVSEIAHALEETFPPDPNTFREVNVGQVMRQLRKLVDPPINEDLGFLALLNRVTP